MKVKVIDQLHLSGHGPDTLKAGDEVEVAADTAKQLADRGLVTIVDDGANSETKADPAPANKAEAAPINKAAREPSNKSSRKRARK